MKKIEEIFLYLVLLITVILVFNIAYCKFIKKEKIISLFNKTIFIVETGSMNPTICEGELIIVSKEKNYKEGDIVTVIDSDNYIYTHRIVKISNDIIVTKGDGNNIDDEESTIENIVGKVVFHSRHIGLFVTYCLKPIIVIYIFLVSIRIIIIIFKENFNEKKPNN